MDVLAPLTTVADLAPGSMKLASLEGNEYLVARVGDEYFVTQSKCPHLGGHLEKGMLEGTVLTCPRHHSQFDLRDGSVVRWTDWHGTTLKIAEAVKHPRPLRTYAVHLEGDTLLVDADIAADA
jgi:3-phenylpropionate/trans-cinnamate dioxygenase ferredoxin component